GGPITTFEVDGRGYFLRIVKYLAGKFLGERKCYPAGLPENFGGFLGQMDYSLRAFDHPHTHRYHDWDLQHALDWERYLPLIPSPGDRRVIAYFLLQFEENVLPF